MSLECSGLRVFFASSASRFCTVEGFLAFRFQGFGRAVGL